MRDGSRVVRLGPGNQRRQSVTRVRDAVGVTGGVLVFVAAGGVGGGGEDEGEGAAVKSRGEVAEVDGVTVGDAGGCAQDPPFAVAADDRADAQGSVEVWPGDVGPQSLAVDVRVDGDQAGVLQLR